MKKIKLLTAVLLTACALAGCGQQGEEPTGATGLDPQPIPIESETEQESQTPESTEDASSEENVAATATIVDRTVVDGKMQASGKTRLLSAAAAWQL